jgi:calcium-dependent protein kinase
MSVTDIEKAMEVIDSNNNGVIDYTEFIAACMYSQDYSQELQIKQAFQYFDKDGSGTISADELRVCLQSQDQTLTDDEINNMISQVDENQDGMIDYEEFLGMMMG